MTLSGKTLNLLSRLPAFYEAETADSLLFQLLNVWGEVIERAEVDLFRVMRSHHVNTATNEGSQGFGTNQQGDLDRIFALYLEALGGTSQLTQVEPLFRPGAFKNLPGFLMQLQAKPDRLSSALVQGFSAADCDRLRQLKLPLTNDQYLEWETVSIERLNCCLEEPLFYQQHRRAFTVDMLSPATERLIEQAPKGGRDLAVLNRALLEAAYPNAIETSDTPYRERLLALIRVLRRGAATKQGICDIVAANLGIFSDSPAAQKAKDLIRIEEYLPELISDSVRIHPFSPEPTVPTANLTLPQTFQVTNPNVFPTVPGFKFEVQDLRQPRGELPLLPLQPLVNLRLINLDNEDYFEVEQTLQVNDVLRILADGTLFLNGVKLEAQAPLPSLPLYTSRWRIEAKVGEAEGQFDQTLFDLSRYDRAQTELSLLDRQQAVNYALAVTVELAKITPGAFRVRIPWNIPGFTDKFSLYDHPRTQIPAIINKVKAAGVMVAIDYEQTWTEIHTMFDLLTVVRSPFEEVHAIEEANFKVGSTQAAYPDGIQHDHSDRLLLSGVFDYTYFDSGNRFA